MFYSFLERLNDFLWGPFTLTAILGTGLWLQLSLRCFPLRNVIYAVKFLIQGVDKCHKSPGDISPFRALMTSLSATIGTGNIAGVATAVAIGGPGAIFWMWVAGLVGMATKFSEAALAVRYRKQRGDGTYSGGPMYYIRYGLKKKWHFLSIGYAFFGSVTSFGLGNMVQANAVSDVLDRYLGVPVELCAVFLAISVAFVILGGIGRISQVAGKLVPFMSLVYLLSGLSYLFLRADRVVEAFTTIFLSAFDGYAMTGGFAGSTMLLAMHYGVSRGVFSNEAGLGSAAISHASATTRFPVKQGMIAMLGTCIDTLGICTMTGLVIVTSGKWKTGITGANLTSEAFGDALPFGQYIVVSCLCLFAFTTILGWCFYGEKCFQFLFGSRWLKLYRIAWIFAIPIGAIAKLNLIWMIADIMNAFMAFPNLIALCLLSPTVFRMVKQGIDVEYEEVL